MKKILLGLSLVVALSVGSFGYVAADVSGGVSGGSNGGVTGGGGGTGSGGGFQNNPGGNGGGKTFGNGTTSTAPCSAYILTLPAWYNNLPCDTTTNAPTIQKLNDIWIIVLNVIEDVIQAMGYVTAGFIIWGGIKYIKSQGEPNQLNDAKSTILNSLIGLGIILASVAIINFIVNSLAPAATKSFGS